jgi:serine/threonine-protein kinase
MRALAHRQEDRYASVSDFRREIENFTRSGGWFPLRHFAAGTVILREGEIGDTAFIIQSGWCEVYRGEGASRSPLHTLGPGEVLGEIGFFRRGPRIATVAAIDDVTALVVTEEQLAREVTRASWMGPFLRLLAERFEEAQEARFSMAENQQPAGTTSGKPAEAIARRPKGSRAMAARPRRSE